MNRRMKKPVITSRREKSFILMAHILYTGDEDIHVPGISRTIYDPACGTGGMLSVSEEYIRGQNPQAHLTLFGQD